MLDRHWRAESGKAPSPGGAIFKLTMRYDNPRIIERIDKSKNYVKSVIERVERDEIWNELLYAFNKINTRANVFGNVRLLAEYLVSAVNAPGVKYHKQKPFYIVNLKNTRWAIRKHYNNLINWTYITAELLVDDDHPYLQDIRIAADTILAVDYFFPEFERRKKEIEWESQKKEIEMKVVNTTNKYR